MTASRAERNDPLVFGEQVVPPGEVRRVELPVAMLPTHTPLGLELTVLNGRRPGPVIWVSAAIHGDEINGIEVIRKVLDELSPTSLRGAVLAVPIVNVFGFIQQSRYLPDRRDLNRSFPGSSKGSLAARIAHLFMTEIVAKCSHGLDLHTASNERSNLPQVRGDLDDPETRRCAEAFGAPVMVHSVMRNGSLRGAADKVGVPVLVYEGGEALRFNPTAIDAGVRGVLGVLHYLGMISRSRRPRKSVFVPESSWIRARKAGVVRLSVEEGDTVEAQDVLGIISDPFGMDPSSLRAPFRGIVIGRTNNPVVHAGDAVVHVGKLEDVPPVSE